MADKLRGGAELPSVSTGREGGSGRPDASGAGQSQEGEAGWQSDVPHGPLCSPRPGAKEGGSTRGARSGVAETLAGNEKEGWRSVWPLLRQSTGSQM